MRSEIDVMLALEGDVENKEAWLRVSEGVGGLGCEVTPKRGGNKKKIKMPPGTNKDKQKLIS